MLDCVLLEIEQNLQLLSDPQLPESDDVLVREIENVMKPGIRWLIAVKLMFIDVSNLSYNSVSFPAVVLCLQP